MAFRLQYRRRAYHAPTYWFTVMMVAIFGTMVADGIKDGLGLSYAITTPFFAALVGLVFWRWQRSEGTLDIHTITTRRRETYYWAAVLATFALGTAAGDLTAITLNWGFLPSAILFGAVIAVPLLGWWRFGLNPVVAFWAAYVVTRPLGASFADWFSKPHVNTGLGLGDGTVCGDRVGGLHRARHRHDDPQGRHPAPRRRRRPATASAHRPPPGLPAAAARGGLRRAQRPNRRRRALNGARRSVSAKPPRVLPSVA